MWRRRREDDLDRELRAHIDLEAEERGDAAAARRALGNVGLIKEDVRRTWGWTSIGDFARHLRQSIRSLARRPAFAVVAVLSLAAGIGANTAVFSLARGIVLKTLPAPGANRMVLVRQNNPAFRMVNCCFTYAFFNELRRTDPDLEDALAVSARQVTLEESGQAEKVNAEIVSGNYFRMLDVRPSIGRLLDEKDEATARVCVISYDLWQDRFAGGADVIGRQVKLGTEAFQIVGVTQRGFSGAELHTRADVQMPAWVGDVPLGRQASVWAQIIARLKPGVRRDRAEARLLALGKQIEQVTGPQMGPKDDFLLEDGSQGIGSRKQQFGKPVIVLFLLVAVVLLVVCCNLAALLLVRSVERSREAGMRLAIGASRGALIRQFLIESLMLAGVGGVAGWGLAHAMNRVLLSLLDTANAGLVQEAQLDWNVFAFCAGLTLVAGLLFGVLPAWRASRVDPLTAIRGAATGGSRSFLASTLIAAQIALSLALLFGAGLFTQTLRHLRAIDLGFNPENLLLIHIDDRNHGSSAPAFFGDLLERARAMPERPSREPCNTCAYGSEHDWGIDPSSGRSVPVWQRLQKYSGNHECVARILSNARRSADRGPRLQLKRPERRPGGARHRRSRVRAPDLPRRRLGEAIYIRRRNKGNCDRHRGSRQIPGGSRRSFTGDVSSGSWALRTVLVSSSPNRGRPS